MGHWIAVAVLLAAFVAVVWLLGTRIKWAAGPLLLAAGIAAYILNGWKFY